VLDSIFGGSTSSRLFREIREKRGLAYSVGSYSEQYTDSGMVATYVGTREENVEEACAVIGAELERLRSEPVSAEELTRAKENVKGRLVLSSESTAARMTRISRATLFGLPIESLDQMLAKVDAVSVEELSELAGELYGAERLSAACVGRDEKCFRKALSPISEALSSATSSAPANA
jgi:predicted Zn-dependent peptidase